MSKQSKYVPVLSPLVSLFLGRKSGAILTSASYPSPLQCNLAYDDRDAWRTHWASLNQSWRTEPEIDAKRQEELSTRRVIVPDVEKGMYPFRGMKLNRADVEWLLATHESGRGPVDWNDEKQRNRKGLDLRGVDLCKTDLSKLPLACMLGGLGWHEQMLTTSQQREPAAIHLKGAVFNETHLEGADLSYAYLEKAVLTKAYLEKTTLFELHANEADFTGACMKKSELMGADLTGAIFSGADLREVNAFEAHLEKATFWNANLEKADFWKACLNKASMRNSNLKGCNFFEAQMEEADLENTHLEGANFFVSHLEKAEFYTAHVEGANFTKAHLEGADLSGAFFDSTTRLHEVSLCNKVFGCVFLADVRWGDVNLNIVDWSAVSMLGDERAARWQKLPNGKTKSKKRRLEEYRIAVRANRQLTVALLSQGLNEDAARFAYRAQVLQRKVFWMQRDYGKWFFSLLLAILAGYGYRIWRILVAYLFIVLLCAIAYFILGMYYEPHLSILEAILTSVTAFHGRVFAEPFLRPEEPQLWVTAFEAVTGLIIEGVFIAMLTQKFFGK